MQAFNKEQAATYDERFAKLAPQRDALHLLIRILLGDLPERARVLCVGAGTGAELLALARAFPGFEFTAVEPAQGMLEVCQQRAHDEGITSRCVFHHGYLSTLPHTEPFDVATSLLVSQFLKVRAERVEFFQQIAARLRPGAFLINADLSGDMASEEFAEMREFWQKMLLYTGTPLENALGCFEAWKNHVGVLPPDQVAAIITEGGFAKPTLFYQSLFIHGWYTRRLD